MAVQRTYPSTHPSTHPSASLPTCFARSYPKIAASLMFVVVDLSTLVFSLVPAYTSCVSVYLLLY